MNITTVFHRSGIAPKADCYEKTSNSCLYFLRNAIGFKSYFLVDQSSPNPLTNIITKTNRIVSTIFAFLLLLPLTLVGLILLRLSKTHKFACSEIKANPVLIPFTPKEPPKPIIVPIIPSIIVTSPTLNNTPPDLNPNVNLEPQLTAPPDLSRALNLQPLNLAPIIEIPTPVLKPVAVLKIHSLKEFNEKKSLLQAPILSWIHLNPNDFSGKELTDVLLGITEDFTKRYPDPTKIECGIKIADSKKNIPSDLLDELSIEETRTFYQMTQYNLNILNRIIRGLAEDDSLVTSKNELMDKLKELFEDDDDGEVPQISITLLDYVSILLALQYVKSFDARASLEVLKELELFTKNGEQCCNYLDTLSFLKTLDINTDEFIYSLVKVQRKNIENGVKDAKEKFSLFMTMLSVEQLDSLTNYINVTKQSNCEFLLSAIYEEPAIESELKDVIDKYSVILKKSQIADPIDMFKGAGIDVVIYACLATIHIAGSSHPPISTDTIANPVKQAFSVVKNLTINNGDPTEILAQYMGELAALYPQYIPGIFKGINEANNQGLISTLPKIISSVMEPIIKTQSQQSIQEAFHEFFTRFSDLDFAEFLASYAPLLPLIENHSTLKSVCEALKSQDKQITFTPTKTTGNLDKSFQMAARNALLKGYNGFKLALSITKDELWAMF